MVASSYLHLAEYAAYGVEGATEAQVAAASRLVDAYLGTTSGLLWSPDAAGNPGWMTGKTAIRTYQTAVATLPGAATQLTVTGAAFGHGVVGQAVVLNRANSDRAETCVIVSAIGGTLTLESTAFPHDAGSTIEFGLLAEETLPIGGDGMLRVGARPVARLVSIVGDRRYGCLNLRDAPDEVLLETNYNQAALWGGFPLGQCAVDSSNGCVWLLPGSVTPYGAGSRVRVSYIAGWNYANLPAAIKQAVASSVLAGLETGMGGNIKLLKAGDATIERFRAGALDSDSLAMLAPYRNVRL